MPNAVEAMAYTRTDTPRDALYALADRVPLAVVTDGANGALAIDSTTGEEAHVPAPAGAGARPDRAPATCSAPASCSARCAGWPLADRLAFATLCSALAVQQFGGSLAAPGWGDIADWWHEVRRRPASGGAYARLAGPPLRVPRASWCPPSRWAPCAGRPPPSPGTPTSEVIAVTRPARGHHGDCPDAVGPNPLSPGAREE